jgi:hypothetical protein
MSKPSNTVDLAARIAFLEHRQRFLPALTALALASVVAAATGFARHGPGVIQAERIELVDAQGAIRAALGTDTTGVSLTVYDKRGRVTASLQLNGEPRLTVRDAGGREVAALGAPRVQHLVQ